MKSMQNKMRAEGLKVDNTQEIKSAPTALKYPTDKRVTGPQAAAAGANNRPGKPFKDFLKDSLEDQS